MTAELRPQLPHLPALTHHTEAAVTVMSSSTSSPPAAPPAIFHESGLVPAAVFLKLGVSPWVRLVLAPLDSVELDGVSFISIVGSAVVFVDRAGASEELVGLSVVNEVVGSVEVVGLVVVVVVPVV